jgi:hypothetical protein
LWLLNHVKNMNTLVLATLCLVVVTRSLEVRTEEMSGHSLETWGGSQLDFDERDVEIVFFFTFFWDFVVQVRDYTVQ